MPRLIRCPAGHVFDSEAHAACPHCPPETVAPVATQVASPPLAATGDVPVAAVPVTPASGGTVSIPRSWLIGGGAALVIAVGVVAVLLSRPAKKVDPPPRLAATTQPASNPAAAAPKSEPGVYRAPTNQDIMAPSGPTPAPGRAPTNQDIIAPSAPAPGPAPNPTADTRTLPQALPPLDPPGTQLQPPGLPPFTPQPGNLLPVQPPQQQAVVPTPQQILPAAPTPGNVQPASLHNHADELTDWNVAEQLTIQGNIGSRTPLDIPGATRITTNEVPTFAARSLLLDVLDETSRGGHATLPGAIHLPGAGNFGRGNFNDNLQRSLTRVLSRLTSGNYEYPMIFFCEGAQCWESYNAALRARAMGYRNIYWYRGGLKSWKAANLPLQAPVATYRIR